MHGRKNRRERFLCILYEIGLIKVKAGFMPCVLIEI